MSIVIDVLSWLLIAAGSLFILAGGIGMIRLPDFFTRIHAVSVIDTVGSGFLLIGLMLQAGATLVTVKLVFLLVLFFFIWPVASHALSNAALAEGLRPVDCEDRTEREVGSGGSEATPAAAPAASGGKGKE
jgi:multicomponent Na+:H+ antiporter subunit G